MSEGIPSAGQSSELMKYLRVTPEQIRRAYGTIEQEFGSQWLRSLAKRYKTNDVARTTFHPIYHGLLSGVVNPMTLLVVELATYLEYIHKSVRDADVVLPRLVKELKCESKFDNYLFQLMVTARLRLVVPELSMEPIIEGRQPDIAFSYLGTEFIVEATRLNHADATRKLHDFLERLFFWLSDVCRAERLDLRLTAKTPDLHKREFEMRTAIQEMLGSTSSKISTDAFDIERYEFRGTIADFQRAHEQATLRGSTLAFATSRTNALPFPPDFVRANLPCGLTFVADLGVVVSDLYKDIADKIDLAVRGKVDRLKPLWDKNREIYVFADLGGVLSTRPLDLDEVVRRLNANVFDKYPGLLGGVALAIRHWDQELRRHRMITRVAFAPGSRRTENLWIFRDVLGREAYNDFVGSVVGWGVSESAQCTCGSGKSYGDCCKGIPTVEERLLSF